MLLRAHSAAAGREHPLEEHLRQTALLAEQFASSFEVGDWGRLAGLLHDIGKASPRFQRYLQGLLDSGGDHKLAGAAWAVQHLPPPAQAAIALVIAGHHSGLYAPAELKSLLPQAVLEQEVAKLGQALGAECVAQGVASPPWLDPKDPLEVELCIRMLLSALVDADFLDTEAYFHPERVSQRGRFPSLQDCLARFQQRYDATFGAVPDSPVNRLRRELYQRCVEAAQKPPGAYSLTAPTGSGKTLASLAFALHHALRHGLQRVIVVIPYTSIIEQTADEFRKFVPPEAVLEHHSAVTLTESKEEETASWLLATENWDAPLIVTTAVQFCESLFANTPSRCRKLHNIARSVVILDEVQTLPVGLLEPTFSVLASLVRHYGVSCLLMTATQPAYRQFAPPPLNEPKEIVPDPPEWARRLQRVHYRHEAKELSWEEVAAHMQEHGQAMAVVNTRGDARALYEALPSEARFHLSTNLCGAHRREVLAAVKSRLENQEPCLLATTQVVEAGVDIDFPLVLRAIGPLVNIVQAAGRCNREGRLARGTVIVFSPQAGHLPPGAYRTATETTQNFLAARHDAELDLGDPRVHEAYFQLFYQGVCTDERDIQKLRQSLDFPAVAKAYRLIETEGVPVVVPWKEGHELLEKIRQTGEISREDWRRLQPYLVNLSYFDWEQACARGLCAEVLPRSGLYSWEGRYDEALGVVSEQSDLIF